MIEENHLQFNSSWTRIKAIESVELIDSVTDNQVLGVLKNTYAVQILGNSEDGYVKVFSPDLNCDGYVKKEYLM